MPHVALRPRKEPGEEIHGSYRHADAKDDSSEHSLIPAFTEGEHQAANDNGDEAEALGNRAGESSLKLLDRVFPGAITALQQDECEHQIHVAHPLNAHVCCAYAHSDAKELLIVLRRKSKCGSNSRS
jgi:hypothetical protein